MWLSLPNRVRWRTVIWFLGILCPLLLIQHSSPTIVGCFAIFVVLSADAFNRCGGLLYPSGAYVTGYSMLVVIVGVVLKALTWEPVQENLRAPEKTFLVYIVSIAMVWLVCLVNSKLRARKALLQNVGRAESSTQMVVGLVVAAYLIRLIVFVWGNDPGSIGAALNQINHFLPLALLLAFYAEAKRSGGKRSVTIISFAIALDLFLSGIQMASKQIIFTPIVAWFIGAASAGYYLPKFRAVIIAVVLAVLFPLLSAYSQFARNDLDQYSNPIKDLIDIAMHPMETYVRGVVVEERPDYYHFFSKPVGAFERLNMVAPDDALVNLTDNDHEHGMQIVWDEFYNNIPHFLAPNKEFLMPGNSYAHELGMLAPDDTTTGISFSPTGESYHVLGMKGVLLVFPIVLLLLFWVSDSITGDVRKAPWTMLYILLFLHGAPEGGIGFIIYQLGIGLVAILLAIFVSAVLSPLAGTLFVGPEKRAAVLSRPVRSIARRDSV